MTWRQAWLGTVASFWLMCRKLALAGTLWAGLRSLEQKMVGEKPFPTSLQISQDQFIQTKARGPLPDVGNLRPWTHPVVGQVQELGRAGPSIDSEIQGLQASLKKQAGLSP